MKFNKREIGRIEYALKQFDDVSSALPSGYSTTPEDIKRLREDLEKSKEWLEKNKTVPQAGHLYHKLKTDGAFYREDQYFKITDVDHGTVLYDFLSICVGAEYQSMAYDGDRYSHTFEEAVWDGIEECSDKIDYFNKMADYILNAPRNE